MESSRGDADLAPIEIVLDGEPRGKGRPRFSRKSGVAYTPRETRSYETALRWAAQIAMRARKPLEGPLSVEVTAFMPIPHSWPKWKQQAAVAGTLYATGKPDADNLLKMLDALNGVVFRDDSQIVMTHITKLFSSRPSLQINVWPLKEAEVSHAHGRVRKAAVG